MAIASLEEFKQELSWTDDLGTVDDALMARHLAAAEAVIERSLGFTFASEYPGPAPVPDALKQAVLWLAVDFYEGRGRPEDGKAELPPHVEQIVSAFREWTF